MNLLLITQDFPPSIGGIETYSAELALRFSQRTNEFAVITPYKRNHAAFDQLQPYDLYRVYTPNAWLPLIGIPLTVRLVFQKKVAAVFHAQWQTVISSLLARLLGAPIKIYVAVHGRELLTEPFAGRTKTTYWLRRIRDRLLKKVDIFFPVSNYTASLLREMGIDKSKIQIIGNGTNPEEFYPEEDDGLRASLALMDKKIVLSVCRLVKRKGIDTALYAFSHVVKEDKNAVYLIGGTGPYNKTLSSLIEDLNLQEHVRLLGKIPQKQLVKYYNLCDVFVMPAREEIPNVEGFGIVFLEANACGKPVIGANTGGIPDAIIDGKTGLLVEPDDPTGLAEAIMTLLNDPAFAQKLGAQGLERVRKVANWNKIAELIFIRMQQRL